MAKEAIISKHLEEQITREGAELLMKAYAKNQAEGKGLKDVSPKDFADKVGWRVYTEWCCSPESRGKDHCFDYHGQAFVNWVRDETHYLLESLYGARFRLTLDGGGFLRADGLTQFDRASYESARDLVLSGIVAIAVPYFEKWGGKTPAENLRRSVAGFLIAGRSRG